MKRLCVLAIAAILTFTAVTAGAYWTAASVSGGSASAAASSVGQGATPSVSAVGQAITVSWTTSTLSSGQAVTGYLVKRYDAGTLAPQTILSACTGTVTATSCVESNVPNGSWKYAVTPVFATNWQGLESATSATAQVVVDPTAPTNAITLSSVTGGAYLSSGTVYYRGAAAGSLRVTNAVADAGSGPASSQTSTLTGISTGWTHTPSLVSTPSGGPYVSTVFDWAVATTSSPGEAVTGRDVAGNTSVTNLSFLNDSTAPSAGTITYADGFAAGTSASISFITGTDAGSGLATRRLQRAVASLSDSTCGSFGAFVDIGADSPTSAYTDSSLGNACYKYRYVVTDRVGNQDVATSASIVKIGYTGAVGATVGLLSHWRLGETVNTTPSSTDSFTGTSGAALASHTGEVGATWVHKAGLANATISDANRVRRSGLAGYTIDYTTTSPPTADYSVSADLVVKSNLLGDMVGVVGRMNTSTTTFYMARWEASDTSWNLVKYTNGTVTYLNFVSGQPALTVNSTYRLKLEMTGSTLNLYVDGVLKASAVDTSLTAVGNAGIMDGTDTLSIAKLNSTGLHLDNFQVLPATRAMDSKGTNHGVYVNGVTLGAAGAMAGDSNTAAQFDGVNDHVQMTGTTGIPVGSTSRSVEAWFKTSSAARQVIFDYGSLANTQQFGLWLDAGGATMSAWGFGNGNDKVFTMPAAVNNGSWHQVVLTYNGTSLMVYIDGVALPAQAATRSTVMDAYGFGIGAIINPGDANSGGYFSGTIDEVSFYTTVLSQATVTEHFELGGASVGDTSGPTGGSVDATGLVGTGARYSTSTTLSLDLVKGTDPSGLATTGNEVRRATSSLTGGVCGTFVSYTLVAGGSDPASPMPDTVTDQACFSYQYVVHDTHGNATTYTSGPIKVDGTPPAAPSLAFSAFTNTYWSGSGTTVYYRSAAASGSVTATGTTSDAASGLASWAFPALGANWTSTPGALGVHTYSWSGAPAAPGTKTVTATNNATLVSPSSSFTLVDDSIAPAPGTVSYPDGPTSSSTVTVTFAAGSDAGSGVSTRLLQRASAVLTDGICGTFGGFTTVAGGTDPSSPLIDSVTVGSCYKYDYVVTDRVGNTHVATSASVARFHAGGHWTFDEGAGTSAADTSGNGRTATLQAAASWTAGRVGSGALNLTGAATSFANAAGAAIDTSHSYSVGAWIKPNGTYTGHHTFAAIDGATISPFYLQTLNGQARFAVRAADSTSSVETVALGGAITAGVWTHVVGVHDNVNDTISIYVNGVWKATTPFTSPWQATGATTIGRAKWGGAQVDLFNGAIDDVRMHAGVWTPAEIATLAAP